jgi:hypothetical protein
MYRKEKHSNRICFINEHEARKQKNINHQLQYTSNDDLE